MPLQQSSNFNVHDYPLDIDDLNRPVVLDMMDIKPGKMNSAIVMIMRLLFLKKGVYMDHPDLGIDIRGRYRFTFVDELDTLQKDLENQITTYLPEFSPVDVRCEYQNINKQNCVVIYIAIKEIAYKLVYNTQTESLEGLRKRLGLGGL